MFKNCTIINKNTGEIFIGQIDTELENVEGYPYREATEEEIKAIASKAEQEIINQNARDFLNQTDWLVIRHRDQLALGIPTSLTEEEFRQLLLDRQAARDQVIRQ